MRFDAADQEYARAIQRACNVEAKGLTTTVEPLNEHPGDPEGGSSDRRRELEGAGHASVRRLRRSVRRAAWPVVARGGAVGQGHAARIEGAVRDARRSLRGWQQRDAIRAEFTTKTKGQVYSYIPTAAARAGAVIEEDFDATGSRQPGQTSCTPISRRSAGSSSAPSR